MSLKKEQFFVSEENVKYLKINRDRLGLRFQVKITIEDAPPSMREIQGSWCVLEGDASRINAAQTYIKAMTSPEDTAEMKIPYKLFGELTDEKTRLKLERDTKAVVEYIEEPFNDKEFNARVKGDSVAVALALSTLEDRVSRLREESSEADVDTVRSTSMNPYTKSTSSRLDQSLLAMSDEYEIDKKHLDKIPDIVKKLIVSWANEDSDDNISEPIDGRTEDDSLEMDLSSNSEPSGTMLTLSETGYDQLFSTTTPRVSLNSGFKSPSKSLTTPITTSLKTTSTPFITDGPSTSKQVPDVTPINTRTTGLTVDMSEDHTFRPSQNFSEALDTSTDKFPVLSLSSGDDEDETIIQVPTLHKQVAPGSTKKKKSVADRLKEGKLPSDSGVTTGLYKSPQQSKSTVVVKKETSVNPTADIQSAVHREIVEVKSDEDDSVIEIPKMSTEEKELHEHMLQKYMRKAQDLGYDELDIVKTNSMLDTVKEITELIYFEKLDKISPSTKLKRFISPLKPTPDEKRFREDGGIHDLRKDDVDHRRGNYYGNHPPPCYKHQQYPNYSESNSVRPIYPRTQPTQVVKPQIPAHHERQQHQYRQPQPHLAAPQNLPNYQRNDPFSHVAPQREVVKIHDEAEAKAALHRPVKELLHVEQERAATITDLAPLVVEVKTPRRMVILDGSNIAFHHGKRGTMKNFSCKGIALAIQYLVQKFQCKDIKCVIPLHRKSDNSVLDRNILDELDNRDYMIFSPSKKVGGKRMVPYDDRLILDFARETNGVVISNDRYVDLLNEGKYQDVIMNRVIMYTFMGDYFYLPNDPMGKDGPSLENLLTDPQSRSRPNSGYSRLTGTTPSLLDHPAPLRGYNAPNNYRQQPHQQSTSYTRAEPSTKYRLPVETSHMRQELSSMFPDDAERIARLLDNYPAVTDVTVMANILLGLT